MRRFFPLSLFLHGVLLMLLFSWEIPLAGKAALRNVIQVSLIEKEEERAPSPKVEKAVERPKAEKRIEKREPKPPAEPKEMKREIPKEPPKEEPPPRKQAAESEPVFQTAKSESVPNSPAVPSVQTSEKPAGEAGKGDGEDKNKPGAQDAEGAFRVVSLNPGPEKEGVAGGRGEMLAKVPGGEGGSLPGIPAGTSLKEGDSVLSQIIRRIEEAKRYPRTARRMGIEGTTVVRFKLKPGGQVETVEVVESSGSDILDEASLKTVRDAAPLPYKDGWLKVGIVFKIL
jgi:protein TonB